MALAVAISAAILLACDGNAATTSQPYRVVGGPLVLFYNDKTAEYQFYDVIVRLNRSAPRDSQIELAGVRTRLQGPQGAGSPCYGGIFDIATGPKLTIDREYPLKLLLGTYHTNPVEVRVQQGSPAQQYDPLDGTMEDPKLRPSGCYGSHPTGPVPKLGSLPAPSAGGRA